jgi:steroid 5-alpha reductase family enzyme
MLGTILILILTVIVVPIMSFYFGTPLNTLQSEILNTMGISVSVVIAYCFLIGELTKNNSQVDKLWSIVPIWYVWQMTFLGFQGYEGGFDERMILMAVLVTIWGIRLTYNFARRGAYQWKFWAGEEDYRWEILRKKPGFNNRFIWMIFNLFFISAYQNVLIFLFTLPILTALNADSGPLNYFDWLLAVLFVACVVIEYIADQQQYDFQTEKHRRIKSGEDLGEYKKGFISKGLWGIVRHPNYAMEQSIWVIFYLFSVISTGEWINWSMPGCLLLLVLFKGSSDFSESISAEKYPEYKNYQKRVPRFIPFTKFSKND